mgnify:FL=1
MQAQDQTLDKVICFELGAISLWSGRRKLKKEDLKLQSEDEVPPEALASLGSKKVIDPEEISDFEAMKKEAHRECAKIGIRFLGGYAVPEAAAKDLAATLDEIGARFAKKKADFLANYDATVSTWIAAHPEWSSMLNAAALTRADVDSKLHYGWTSFRVVAAAADEAEENGALNKGLSSELKGLSGQLYREIAKAAALVMEQSLLGRDRVSQKILSPIRTIRGKLLGLSFLDTRVQPLIGAIDHATGLLPKAGWIDGMALSALHGLVFILSDVDRMISYGQMVVDGAAVDKAFEASVPGLAEEEDELAEVIVEAASEAAAPVLTPAQPSPLEDLFGGATAQPTSSNQSDPFAAGIVSPPPVKRPARSLGLFA